MKKHTFVLVLVLIMAFGYASVAYAITNGQPDGDIHPYVGILVFDVGGVPAWRCSGTLIAPDVVLTAGHCTDGADEARVWFDEEVSAVWDDPLGEYPFGGTTSVEGTPYTNPKYRSDENPYGGGNGLPAFSYRDVGVVVLDKKVKKNVVDTYALLPEVGLIDTLENKTGVDFVGYGVQEQHHGGGPPSWEGLRVRLYAASELVSGEFVQSAEYMRLALNPGDGSGGLCFGDSGGPDLLGGTNTVLAVNSYVTNYNCAGVGYSSLVDIPEILDWIQEFLP